MLKTPDFCVFLHFSVPPDPPQGAKNFSKKKIFFHLKNCLVKKKKFFFFGKKNGKDKGKTGEKGKTGNLNTLQLDNKFGLFWGKKWTFFWTNLFFKSYMKCNLSPFLQALMTGNSKDEDISLLTSIKLKPPKIEKDIPKYLTDVGELISQNEGALSGTGKKQQEEEKKTSAPSQKTKKTKRTTAAPTTAPPAATSSNSRASANSITDVYDELISAPNMASSSLDRYQQQEDPFVPTTSKKKKKKKQQEQAPPESPDSFFMETGIGAKADDLEDEDVFSMQPLFQGASQAPPSLQTGSGLAMPFGAASAAASSRQDLPDPDEIFDVEEKPDTPSVHSPVDTEEERPSPSPSPPTEKLSNGSVTSHMRSIAENYFGPGSPVSEEDETKAMFSSGGVLPPERSSKHAWDEQIWPHVQEREVDFTRGVVKSMEPTGAVVDEGDIDVVVTDLKQRAILIPCYVAIYKYEERSYDLIIHGRTGEVHGKRPWIGSSTYDSVKKNLEHQVFHVRHYIEQSIDHLGINT